MNIKNLFITGILIMPLILMGCGPGQLFHPGYPSGPTSTPSPADYETECKKTDCYKGLDSIYSEFRLASYKCIYVSERTVLWVIKFETPEDYIKETKKIEEAIPELEKFLVTSIRDLYNGEGRVHFFYASTTIAWTPATRYKIPVIFMPFSSDRYSFHSYMHELTHVFGYPNGNGWASEGLAVYLNDRLGGDGNFPNFSKDIDRMASGYLSNTEIMEKIGDPSYYPTASEIRSDKGYGFYALSGSFVKYIIEEIGIDAYLKIYHSVDLQDAMHQLTGKRVQDWKKDWTSHLLE